MKISDIFELKGEGYFREQESHALNDVLESEKSILATGGGSVLSIENRKKLQDNSAVIYLYISLQDMYERLGKSREKSGRPLFDKHVTDRFWQRFNLYYAVSDLIIPSRLYSVNELKEFIYDEVHPS